MSKHSQKGDLITEIATRLDLAGFEGFLATLDDLTVSRIGQTGNLVTWYVEWATGGLPLGYVDAWPTDGGPLAVRFRRMEYDQPRYSPQIADSDAAYPPEPVTPGSYGPWGTMMVRSITDGLKVRGVLLSDKPRVPQKRKNLNTWKVTWKHVKGEWRQAKSYEAICSWLITYHSNLSCSPETLADIILAGEAGLLDD